MDRGQPRRLRGFTLLEAMLTVGIVGILLAIAVPAMRPVVTANAIDLDAEQIVEAVYAAADQARTSAAQRCLDIQEQRLVLEESRGRPLREWTLSEGVVRRTQRLCFDHEGDGPPAVVRVGQEGVVREIQVLRWGSACVRGRSCE